MLFECEDKAIEQAVRDSRDQAAALLPSLEGRDFRGRWRVMAATGLLRADEGSAARKLAMAEGLGWAGLDAGLCYAMTSQLFGMQMPMRPWLSEGQRRRLAGLESGETLLCHALTEAHGGSDPMSMETVAERQPDGSYRLSGEKRFITAAPAADQGLVFVRTGKGRSPFDLSAALVDLAAPGVSRSAPLAKTALPGVPMGVLSFDGVRLSEDDLLGGEGAGFSVLTATTTWERALLMGYALGPMRRMLEQTVEWGRARQHFGRAMGASHLVAGHVADMSLALYRSRQMLYGMARRIDAGAPIRQLSGEAAMVKISVSEDFTRLSQLAAQLGGVRSYIEDSGRAVDLISPLAAMTYAGVNDLLRISVARQAGLPVEN
ncbi:acyl-CoA dehydrogenase family protein [Chromobacterium alticapitis]|nr:acyl-CoA dehydrogenase [Chromobacterium alticapitis]